MDKNAIKKFAVWARRELIARVSQKAEQYGITKQGHGDIRADHVNGRLLSRTEQAQRQSLITRIDRAGKDGYREVMEEVAYTWFNRFIALRFMEVNGYLPSRVRVFTDEQNAFKPQILTEAIHLELDGLDMEKVYACKEKSDDEALFKYLLITQCNALSSILPGMFQRIADDTELLFPDNLLREGSVIQQMIALIPEEDWLDQVQIIGWLYQYYNTEPKDQVFANLKKNIKIGKHDIPAATQLFTPDWIVRYMVENSLGRLWVEGHPDDALKATWKYYLEEAPQEPQVQAQLAEIRKGYAQLKPEDIRCIDPCMGSGHILVYLFDVLVQIYQAYGYSTREAVQSIVENNLYGLDIDDRAAQLAYFAVMMKARQYDRRFFTRGIQPHVMAIQESNALEAFERLQGQLSMDTLCLETANQLIRTFHDAKEYGSILQVDIPGLESADRLMEQLRAVQGDFELMAWVDRAEALLPVLAQQAVMLQQKYDVVVTNPPYMGSSGMNAKLSDFIKTHYAEYKSDFFSTFFVRCIQMAKCDGKLAFFSPYVWMFIQSYEKWRKLLIEQKTIETLIQFEYSAFEEATVPVCTFAFSNYHVDQKAPYLRLTEFRGGMEVQRQKALEAINNHDCGYYYEAVASNFAKIPGSPVAYWWRDCSVFAFPQISRLYESAGRNKTHNNELYVRKWWEISDIIRWQPYANGGDFRRWFGNDLDVVDWSDEAKVEYASHGGLYNSKYVGKQGICWNLITSYKNGFRIKQPKHHYSSGAPTIIATNTEHDKLVLAFLNCVVATELLGILNPTLNTTVSDVLHLPISLVAEQKVEQIVNEQIGLSQTDWDSYETSWDFKCHPLVHLKNSMKLTVTDGDNKQASYFLQGAYLAWKNECAERFQQLKTNEEELNRIFIDIYGLQGELTPEVADRDVTVHRVFDTKEDVPESMQGSAYVRTKRDEVVSLISYAVGCMFGRYSLSKPGLAFAGGAWDAANYTSEFQPDQDGILPICDDGDYFSDDIVGQFVRFIEVVYGKDTLEENLEFIADALGGPSRASGKGAPRQVIRSYFLNDFYADHCKTYQKRPIYWLFDSGKKNGFKCLIYMHRYAPDTIARIRTDYVHEQQSRYRTAIADLENRVASASTAERVKLQKQLAKLRDQAEEARLYEEKIHHYADQMIAIDLDDGVKVNYAKFQDVLGKIK